MRASRGMGVISPSKMPTGKKKPRRDNTDFTQYTYRYYAGTNTYLGASSLDNHVYYMGPDGEMQDEGDMYKWIALAGCQSPLR